MKEKFDYHTVVIGAGRIGSYFAKTLANLRAKVLIIDNNKNFGGKQFSRQMPIEILKKSIENFDKAKSNEENFTFFRSELNLKLNNLIDLKNKNSFVKLGIDSMQGQVEILDKHSLQINGKKITFKNCVFAVGSRFLKPKIENLNNVNYEKIENWFNFDKSFNSVTIVGDDKTSLELAITLSQTNVMVYLINQTDTFANHLKGDLLEKFIKYSKQDNFHILNNYKIKAIYKTSTNQFQIEYSNGDHSLFIISDRLILGGTKKGNLDRVKTALNFESNLRNFPITDRFLRLKNHKNFYAIGSCIGPNIDSNQGIYQANLILTNFAENETVEKFNFDNYAVNVNAKYGFSHIGMSVEEIELQKIKYHIFEYDFKESDSTVITEHNKAFFRAYFDKKHRLLNISIVGENITEISSFFLWLYNSRISFFALNSLSAFPFTNFEIIREISHKYLFENVYDDKKLSFIHKWYLKK